MVDITLWHERGVASFSKGATLCQSEGTHQIVMSCLPPVVGCLLKKGLQMGGSQAPPATPLHDRQGKKAVGSCGLNQDFCLLY